MARDEARLREELCFWGHSMFERGLSPGSSGNLSARLDDGFLVTPTNACLGRLEPDRLAKLDPQGRHLSGDAPTKEIPLHMAFYAANPGTEGVVHLHSTYATLLSCLADIDPDDALPPITPYVVMRIGRVPTIPYCRPGAAEMGPRVRDAAAGRSAILLANHGPVVAGRSFEAAVYAAEELEETAKLVILSRGQKVRLLTEAHCQELEEHFPKR